MATTFLHTYKYLPTGSLMLGWLRTWTNQWSTFKIYRLGHQTKTHALVWELSFAEMTAMAASWPGGAKSILSSPGEPPQSARTAMRTNRCAAHGARAAWLRPCGGNPGPDTKPIRTLEPCQRARSHHDDGRRPCRPEMTLFGCPRWLDPGSRKSRNWIGGPKPSWTIPLSPQQS
jgi:hypothetical protein